MVCHGELARLKPHGRKSTDFFLVISLGGAAGGVFVGILAPLCFNAFVELPFGFLLLGFLLLVLHYRDSESPLYAGEPKKVWRYLKISYGGLIIALLVNAALTQQLSIEQSRNFYGLLRVREKNLDNPDLHKIIQTHGLTVHGAQFVSDQKQLWPTEYFGSESGVGMVFSEREPSQTWRVGIIGLGVGTLLAYGIPGDYFRVYEINPDVVRQAKQYFSFLRDTKASRDIIVGDGRLSLERDQNQEFDLFVVDAFSSDAIPVHLLTREAFELYLSHVVDDGVIALNISNRHLNLQPVLWKIAQEFSLHGLFVDSGGSINSGTEPAEWMLLSRASARLDSFRSQQGVSERPAQVSNFDTWTDNYSNLASILR